MAIILKSVLSKSLHFSKLRTTRLITPLNSTINNTTLQKIVPFPIILRSNSGVYNNIWKFGDQKHGICSMAEEEEEEQVDPGKAFERVIQVMDKNPVIGDVVDCLMRNSMRLYFNNWVHYYATTFNSLPSNNNLTLLQLVLIDENRYIQRRHRDNRLDLDAPDVAELSRVIFREVAPCLLHDTDRWVFSRSMVLNDCNSLINEAPKFTTHDPVGGLRDVPFDLPTGTPDIEVIVNMQRLMSEAFKVFKSKPFDMPFIRCTEVFMFIAGDYAVDDGRLNSRLAIQKLLRELSSSENAKIHGIGAVSGSARVNPEMLSVIKDTHLTA